VEYRVNGDIAVMALLMHDNRKAHVTACTGTVAIRIAPLNMQFVKKQLLLQLASVNSFDS